MPLYEISWLKILESMAHWGKPIIPLNFSDRHEKFDDSIHNGSDIWQKIKKQEICVGQSLPS